MDTDIASFYQAVLENAPYPYQQALALGPWPDMLDIPTGLGKTAAIYCAWQYKRATGDADTPRRLVWCLPMRVLVEQTTTLIRRWVARLEKKHLLRKGPAVHVLMGGAIEQDWDSSPDRDMVLIGTQDQLLSRALNRGYSMSPSRWPLDFALLHSDCLWVFDEVQLMGAGLATSAQLEAFRHRFQTVLPCRSLWCSATLRPQWLKTVDFASRIPTLTTATLLAADTEHPQVQRRIHAHKALAPTAPKPLAKTILAQHRPATLTLVIRNTVKSARDTYTEVVKKAKGIPTLLLHSRFRPQERGAILSKALAPPGEEGLILITTQVVEAGVDISAAPLFTDLAPWSSLVQRFGRCNRTGDIDNAKIFWVNEEDISDKKALPYTKEELTASLALLRTCDKAAPATLPKPDTEAAEYPILRAHDILELFDTTPDLAGASIDVSRFIRDRNETDVQVFWRDWPGDTPPADMPAPVRDELCSVPFSAITDWITRKNALWSWDTLEKCWQKVYRAVPGAIYLIHAASGGYDCALGWDPPSTARVAPVDLAGQALPPLPAMSDDRYSEAPWQTMEDHASRTVEELNALLSQLGGERFATIYDALWSAARFHDWGKAHEVFRKACPHADMSQFWAKAPHMSPYERKFFRHELASGLALLTAGYPDLTAYLAAAHHGKIRLSLRALPGEKMPPDNKRFARGIWEGDRLPAVLGQEAVTLSLAAMELGDSAIYGPSWAERMSLLLEQWGPFRLAMLEALIRIADWRASADPEGGNHG